MFLHPIKKKQAESARREDGPPAMLSKKEMQYIFGNIENIQCVSSNQNVYTQLDNNFMSWHQVSQALCDHLDRELEASKKRSKPILIGHIILQHVQSSIPCYLFKHLD